jgi:hypothetical protein
LHENHQIIEVFETAATSGSAILIFFLPNTITIVSLTLKYYKNKEPAVINKIKCKPNMGYDGNHLLCYLKVVVDILLQFLKV